MSFLIVVSALLAISCEDDEAIVDKDTENPVVSLDMPENQQDVYGAYNLKVTVTDNRGIEKVSYFLDDNLIGEATEEPFELNWDTENTKDGVYTLKVVATDKSGNRGESTRRVRVRNTLVNISMEEGYRSDPLAYDSSEEWFFLSDNNGNVIGETQKLNPGETISWKRPAGFTDEKIVINKFTYINRKTTIYNPKVYYLLDTYTDIPATDIVLAASNSALNALGSAEINIINNLPPGTGSLRFNAITQFSVTPPVHVDGGVPLTLSPALFEKEQQKSLVTYTPTYAAPGEDRVPKFYLMDVQPNKQYQVSTDLFKPMTAKNISIPDEKDGGNIALLGHLLNPEDERRGGFNVYQLSLNSGTLSSNLYYPKDVFSDFTVTGSIYSQFKYTYSFRLNTLPDVIAKPDFTATVTSSDLKNVKLTTNQKHDVLFVRWVYRGTTDGYSEAFERRLFLGNEKETPYALPDVPEVLLNKFPVLKNPVTYAGIVLSDYKGISSYQEFFTTTFGSNSNKAALNYYESILLIK